MEFSELASADTSMALVEDGSEPRTWNSRTGGSGSVPAVREVAPCGDRTGHV